MKNTLLLAFKYGMGSTVFEWIRAIKIKCAAMLLDIDSIEKKLKGVAELKKLFEECCKSEYTIHALSK